MSTPFEIPLGDEQESTDAATGGDEAAPEKAADITTINEQRASFASVALESYSRYIHKLPLEEIRKHNAFDLRELCQDLVSDILHFANQNGIDVEPMVASAQLHYEEELKS
jgi:hypothetical protein